MRQRGGKFPALLAEDNYDQGTSVKSVVRSVCVWEGRGKIEIITQSIVSHSVMRQRCVFARDGDECGAA